MDKKQNLEIDQSIIAELDCWYVRNISFSLDFFILLRTIAVLLTVGLSAQMGMLLSLITKNDKFSSLLS